MPNSAPCTPPGTASGGRIRLSTRPAKNTGGPIPTSDSASPGWTVALMSVLISAAELVRVSPGELTTHSTDQYRMGDSGTLTPYARFT